MLFFVADDGVHGTELWALELNGACCFVDDSCGDSSPIPGCTGSGGIFQTPFSTCTSACQFGSGGDVNDDGDIGPLDHRAFVECLAQPVVSVTQACLQGFDFDVDGQVNLMDFAGLQNAFTGKRD